MSNGLGNVTVEPPAPEGGDDWERLMVAIVEESESQEAGNVGDSAYTCDLLCRAHRTLVSLRCEIEEARRTVGMYPGETLVDAIRRVQADFVDWTASDAIAYTRLRGALEEIATAQADVSAANIARDALSTSTSTDSGASDD